LSGPRLAELQRLAAELLGALARRGQSIATAEATTGGLIGWLITGVPGASATFRAGYAPYSNDAKATLGVPSEVLAEHGAVSREAAEALAAAARTAAEADIAIAETGIAGPAGGGADRSVGLFWIAVSTEIGTAARRFVFPYDRNGNRRACAEAALRLALEAALSSPGAGCR
jgi:PncC family amidohydrolase